VIKRGINIVPASYAQFLHKHAGEVVQLDGDGSALESINSDLEAI